MSLVKDMLKDWIRLVQLGVLRKMKIIKAQDYNIKTLNGSEIRKVLP